MAAHGHRTKKRRDKATHPQAQALKLEIREGAAAYGIACDVVSARKGTASTEALYVDTSAFVAGRLPLATFLDIEGETLLTRDVRMRRAAIRLGLPLAD